MNRFEVWKLKEHVCTACGEELEEDDFRVYHRNGNEDDDDPDNVDLVCPDCYDEMDKTSRGETEDVLLEIEEEMPDATRERKTLEYLRRSSE
jgi:5-methylcytosine-specific restriction endonuclease McrA